MIAPVLPPIELTEYVPRLVPQSDLAERDGEALWRKYGKQVLVEFPSPKTEGQWRLTSLGWVGFIPLTPLRHFLLLPRVSLGNLFRMWEYAYRLGHHPPPDGLTSTAAMAEFYSQLAGVLAKKVLLRLRKGIYKTYQSECDVLTYVRGTLDLRQRLRSPWDPRLTCEFQEHTADIEDNRILTWTLFCIAQSGLCRPETLPTVHAAYRGLRSLTDLEPSSPHDCLGRCYERLNEDYQPLHALCRFFLAHSGPQFKAGEHKMVPFLFEMPKLYEMFVAEWLQSHRTTRARFHPHYRVSVDRAAGMSFDIDLVLEDENGKPQCVLDTKYKLSQTPEEGDVAQVLAYALSIGCKQAVLVYPARLSRPIDIVVGDIGVRSASFILDGDLEAAGCEFLAELDSLLRVANASDSPELLSGVGSGNSSLSVAG